MKREIAQRLIATAMRYYKIRHLDLNTKKRLMALTDEDFHLEFARINTLA
jgi:hypothetical protein